MCRERADAVLTIDTFLRSIQDVDKRIRDINKQVDKLQRFCDQTEQAITHLDGLCMVATAESEVELIQDRARVISSLAPPTTPPPSVFPSPAVQASDTVRAQQEEVMLEEFLSKPMRPYLDQFCQLPNQGYIVCIIGPMFSGKTTELIRIHDRYKIAKKKCVLVKYDGDMRYDAHHITTHQQQKALGCTVVAHRLADVRETLFDEDVEVVAIDEGQFYDDLASTCEQLAADGKIVIVAALNGDFMRRPFAEVSKLISFSNDVRNLSAVCMRCGTDASYTFRNTKETQVEVIGGSDTYQALCRACYYASSIAKCHDTCSKPNRRTCNG
ncbi:unnamed protein product, partial [Mesorhabditis spiculigera]